MQFEPLVLFICIFTPLKTGNFKPHVSLLPSLLHLSFIMVGDDDSFTASLSSLSPHLFILISFLRHSPVPHASLFTPDVHPFSQHLYFPPTFSSLPFLRFSSSIPFPLPPSFFLLLSPPPALLSLFRGCQVETLEPSSLNSSSNSAVPSGGQEKPSL